MLTQLGNVIYTNRPLLFLGCSLEKDRTLGVLQQVASQNSFLTHYAVLAIPNTPPELGRRRDELKQAGIVPVWFTPGQFKQIEVLLERIVERAAADDVGPDSIGKLDSTRPYHVRQTTIASDFQVPPEPSSELTDSHIREVAAAISNREVAFFLGAAIHHLPMTGKEFYQELGLRLGVPPADRNRADVADHLVEMERRPLLSAAVADLISVRVDTPWLVHKIITAIAQHPPASDEQRLMTFTTNYDDVLERTMTAAGVRYHFFTSLTVLTRASSFIVPQQASSGRLSIRKEFTN